MPAHVRKTPYSAAELAAECGFTVKTLNRRIAAGQAPAEDLPRVKGGRGGKKGRRWSVEVARAYIAAVKRAQAAGVAIDEVL